jgi:hypothetical protein
MSTLLHGVHAATSTVEYPAQSFVLLTEVKMGMTKSEWEILLTAVMNDIASANLPLMNGVSARLSNKILLR